MKIVIIGSYPLDSARIGGGVESSVYGLAQELAKKHDVVVYDMPRREGTDLRQPDGGLFVERISNPGLFNLSGSCRRPEIVKNIVAEKPDVCHIHGTGLLSFGLYKELGKKGIPTLLTVHGLANVEKKQSLQKRFSLRKLFRYIYQSAVEFRFISYCSRIVVDSNYVKHAVESYKKNGQIKHLPEIAVVPQGINHAFFKMPCSKDSLNVLSVGSFSPRKGHIFLLQAFDKVVEKEPNAFLTIVGNVSSKEYYNEMTTMAASLPCRDRICFMPNIKQDKLLEVYSQSHVFALHSQEESQGIVFAEAMATGLPVVATRVGGVPDVVENGKSGLLVEFADVDSFAMSILKLLKDGRCWDAMSTRAQELSRQYDWSVIASKIEMEYIKMIQE